MLRATLLSAALHLIIFLLLLFTPTFWGKPEMLEEQVTIVELLPVDQQTNVKTSAPIEPKEQPKEEKKITKPQPKEQPKELKAQPKPREEIKDKAEYLPQKKTKKKIEKETEEKPKPVINKTAHVQPKVKPTPPLRNVEKKPEKKDFSSVLSSIQEISKKYEQKKDTNDSNISRFDSQKPLSISVIDSIRKQVADHWNIDGGARYAENIIVKLHIVLDIDGTVVTVNITDKARYGSDSFYKAAADRARTAVLRVKKFKGLPSGQYNQWRDMRLTFDPRSMFQ